MTDMAQTGADSPSSPPRIPSIMEIRAISDLFSLPRYYQFVESALAGMPLELPFSPTVAAITGPVLEMLQALHRYQRDRYFPQVTRYSAIVTVMTFFEDQANGVCGMLRKLNSIPIAWTELRGDVLGRFRTYTTKLAELAPPVPLDWERLKGINTIRGAIVHANGYGRGHWKDRLEKLVGKIDGFSLDNDGRVQLEANVPGLAVAVTSNVLRHVYEAAPLTSPIFWETAGR